MSHDDLLFGIAVTLHESPAAQPLFFVQDRRSYWRGPPVAGKLLVGVCKSDQRPFAPGPSQTLKAHRQIFSDETHRHNYNRPRCLRTVKRELALRRLAAVTVDFRRKCPDRKH